MCVSLQAWRIYQRPGSLGLLHSISVVRVPNRPLILYVESAEAFRGLRVAAHINTGTAMDLCVSELGSVVAPLPFLEQLVGV